MLVGKGAPLEVLRQCATEKGASEFYECDDILGPAEKEIPNADMKKSLLFADYDAENSRTASAALILLQFHLTQQKIDCSGNDSVKLISHETIEEGVKIRPPCRFEEMDIPITVTINNGSSSTKEGKKCQSHTGRGTQPTGYGLSHGQTAVKLSQHAQ